MKKLLSITIAVMAVFFMGVNPIKIEERACYGIVVHNRPHGQRNYIERFEEKFQNREIINWEYMSDEELEETLKEEYSKLRITRLEYDGDYYDNETLITMMTK